MLSARNTEIQKLYETFESFFPEQHESGKKPKYSYDNRDPYNFRDSTPKTDISGNSDVNRFDKVSIYLFLVICDRERLMLEEGYIKTKIASQPALLFQRRKLP